jgi:hypothetical protein
MAIAGPSDTAILRSQALSAGCPLNPSNVHLVTGATPVDLGPDPAMDSPGLRHYGLRWTEANAGINLQEQLFSPQSPAVAMYITTSHGNVYRITRDATCVSLNASLEFGRPAEARIKTCDRNVVVGMPFRLCDHAGRVHITAPITAIVLTDGRPHPADEVRARTNGNRDRVFFSTETELRGLTGTPQRSLLAVGLMVRSGSQTPHSSVIGRRAQRASTAA